MTNFDLQKLLGSDDFDPGCEDAGDLMDAYCELVARGEPVSDRYAKFLTHMSNCTACREDMEGLLAMLRQQEQSRPR
ncbi:MAG TPA: hypothetical protein VGF24_20785 [Vicinamibacterales bacterium]|jgi:hypothetical protein